MTIGAPEDLIEDRIAPLISSGVIPVKVIPSVAALANLIRHIPELQTKKIVGILDIGAHRSMLVFIKEGSVDFFREIVVGGNDFTKSITGTIFHEGRAIQFTDREAEEFKFRYGYPLGFSDGMTFHGAPLGEVGTMMRPVVERLSGEIERSIGFYKEKASGKDIAVLYLIGGGARLKHLTEVLSENLSIPVSILPYPQKLRVSGNAKQKDLFKNKFPELAISLTLALESTPEKNLLPSTYVKMHRTAQLQRYLTVALFGIIGILAVLTYTYRIKVHSMRATVSQMDRRVAQSKGNVILFDRLQQKRGELIAQINGVDNLVKQDDRLIQVMRLVSHAVPPNLALVSLEYGLENPAPQRSVRSRNSTPDEEEKRPRWMIHIEGMSKKPPSDVGIYLAQLIVELQKSGYFSEVNLISESVDDESKEYQFDLKAYFITGEDNVVG
jgi:cell division ATPase FtsA